MIGSQSALYRFFEWVPLDSAGFIVAVVSLLSREIEYKYLGYDIPFLLATILVFILTILLIGKKLIPSIKAYTYDNHGNKLQVSELDVLDASNGEATIDLHFEVPNHHDEVYVSFEIDGYIIGIEQYTPVNYDNDKSIICPSDIHSFELTLKLTPNSNETSRGSRIPLRIVDKLHDRSICEITVEG